MEKTITDAVRRMVEIRRAHGDSQRSLAAKLGMVQPQIARYEAGTHELSLRYLIRFCQVYQVSADDILGLR